LDGGSAKRKASTYTGQHNTDKRRHTSMPRARFEPAIPDFERSKAVRALDRALIGTGTTVYLKHETRSIYKFIRNISVIVI